MAEESNKDQYSGFWLSNKQKKIYAATTKIREYKTTIKNIQPYKIALKEQDNAQKTN